MNRTVFHLLAAGILSSLSAGHLHAQRFTQVDLTSDTGVGGTISDPNLLNPWGMSRSSGSPWWFSDNGSNLSTLYTGTGNIVPLIVSVPGGPTGTTFNGTTDFQLGGKPATFVFSTEAGAILAWNGGTAATLVASKGNAVYKGLALAKIDGANYLYATDFHHAEVDVLDADFHYVAIASLTRERPFEHAKPFSVEECGFHGFAPFNIQNIGGNLFVTFAKQDSAKHDEVDGPGLGLVAVFSSKGRLLRVFENGPWLNAPWALAEAPGDFGPFSHSLLVGNFGSGQIAAYDEQTGRFLGLFETETGDALSVPGLWALSFGSDGNSGKATELFFTAGPNNESDGLFGKLLPIGSDLTQGNSN